MPMKRPSPRLLLRLIRFASHRRDSRVPRAKPQLQSRRPRWHGRLRPPLASLARRLSCRQGCCARPRGKAPKNFACGANTLPFFWPAAQRSPQNFRLRRRFSPTKIPFTLPLDAANPSRCLTRHSGGTGPYNDRGSQQLPSAGVAWEHTKAALASLGTASAVRGSRGACGELVAPCRQCRLRTRFCTLETRCPPRRSERPLTYVTCEQIQSGEK